MTEQVIITDADGMRTIRMNRPDKKNALTLAMYEAMTAALEGANADNSVHCVLIAGAPGAFSAGTKPLQMPETHLQSQKIDGRRASGWVILYHGDRRF